MRANHLLGLIIAFGTTACATDDVPDELAGESDADDAGKADGNGAFTYWQVSLAADTGGYRITRPNRTVNECGGVRGASCDVSIDLAPTAMPASVAKSYEDRVRGGETLLLRGELGTERPELRYARLSTMAGPAIAAADLAPPVTAAPNIHAGDEAGPDCLYARLFVQDVDVAGAEVTVAPAAGSSALEFRARFTGVTMPSKTEYAITCVNGASSVDVKATALTASGVMTVAADGSISFPAMTYQFEGLSYNSTMPQAINDMLFGNTDALGNIVMSSVSTALAPMVNKRALLATEVWTPGSTDGADLAGVFVIAKHDADGVLERRLNSTRFAAIDELDLAASGASADTVARATAAFEAGEEIILVGYRYKDGDTRGRAAGQFWTRAPVPQH